MGPALSSSILVKEMVSGRLGAPVDGADEGAEAPAAVDAETDADDTACVLGMMVIV